MSCERCQPLVDAVCSRCEVPSDAVLACCDIGFAAYDAWMDACAALKGRLARLFL